MDQGNKFHLYFYHNTTIFIHKNAIEYVFWEVPFSIGLNVFMENFKHRHYLIVCKL